MTKKIIIRERGDDYMAFIEDHPEIWGCGEGAASAVGDLVLSHQEACDVKIEYERDYERLKKEGLEMEQKMEPEILKIGQEVICPKHRSQVIDAIDDSVPQQILYVLTCGCIHPTETIVEKKSSSICRRKGPYSNWG